MIKAVLFDMDGVLSNTEPLHLNTFKKLFAERGIMLTDTDVKSVFGKLDEDILRELFKKKGMKENVAVWALRKRKMMIPILKKAKIQAFPGVEKLVKTLAKSYALGLGTSSSHEELDVIMDKLSLKRYFKVIFGREDVEKHKPDPELYQKLCDALNAKPNECVVIEDSVSGIMAAKRAGMRCIAVKNSFPASKLKQADVVVERLDDPRIVRFIAQC